MKKYLVILILSIITINMSAKGVNSILQKYKSIEGVETFHLNSFMSFFVNLTIPKGEDSFSIKSLSVITMNKNEVGEKKYNDFKDDIDRMISKEKLEILLTVNEDDSKVKILAKSKGEFINEMIILSYEENETALINFIGKIRLSDINESFMEKLPIN